MEKQLTDRELAYRDLLEIVQWVEKSAQVNEFRLSYKGVEIEIVKTRNGERSKPAAPRTLPGPDTEPVQLAPESWAAEVDRPAASPTSPGAAAIPDGMHVIKAPMVGTFYRAPEPGAQPFVRPGDAVKVGDTLCILEVMKLMNSLDADAPGVVREILVADGQVVEYAQPLILIEPTL